MLTHTNTNTTSPYQHNIYTCAYTYKSNLILYMLVRFMFIRILFVSLLIDCIKKVSSRFSHPMYKWHTLYPFCGHLRKLKASLFHVVVADQTRIVREKNWIDKNHSNHYLLEMISKSNLFSTKNLIFWCNQYSINYPMKSQI